MKNELFELLPTKSRKETKNDVEIAEDFFKNNKELRQSIVLEKEGVYYITLDSLKKIECPIKRKNGKDYWEAFFLFLGFEYYKTPRTGRVYLMVR